MNYFQIPKSSFVKQNNSSIINLFNPNFFPVNDSKITGFLMEHIKNDMFCFDINEKLEFMKLDFLPNKIPCFVPLKSPQGNLMNINLKKLIFPDKNTEKDYFDISLIKSVGKDFIIINGFHYTKDCKNPNDFIQVNIFLNFSYEPNSNVLNILKTYLFTDIYYPDAVYGFKSKPVIEANYIQDP